MDTSSPRPQEALRETRPESLAETMPETLEALAAALRARLGQSAVFQILNTRLIIQHGVDLKALTPAQKQDAALFARIRDALARMGIRLGGDRP
jgi:hypothetical protein